MIALHSLILLGFLLVPYSQGEEIWMLNVKQLSERNSEKQVPRKLRWALYTPSGLSCAALCLQRSGCSFYGYHNRICHGYLGSEVRSSPIEMSAIFKGHFKPYLRNKGITEQATREHKSKGIKEQAMKDHKRKGTKEQAINDHKSKAVDDGYRHLKSSNTHLYVKKHNNASARDEALKVCQTESATLVKLDTQTKVQLFRKEFRIRHVLKQVFWIGLSDRYDNDTWYWTDGTRLGFRNWGLGEPHHRHKDKNEDCVGITLQMFSSGTWFDLPCQQAEFFVGESV